MREECAQLPVPESEGFASVFNGYLQSILSRTAPDFTIRQYLRAIFTCAIKYNHQPSVSFLFQLPWFTPAFSPFVDILDKLLRWYRGKGKECTIACYTLLAEGFITAAEETTVVDSALKLLEGRYDHQIFLNTLKDTFPHKNRPLEHHETYIKTLLSICNKKPCLRPSILETILEKLSTFDTEIKAGDALITRPFFEDLQVYAKEREPTDLENKLDHLLILVLDYVETHPQIKELTQQLLLIFHRKFLIMGQNKYIQYIMFYVSESKNEVAGYFLSILINTLMEHNQVAYRKAYINNVFYLGSYLVRSQVSAKRLKKAVRQMIRYALDLIEYKPQIKIDGLLLGEILQQNEHFLYIYQSILFVFVHKPFLYQELSSEFNSLYQQSNLKCCSDLLINSQILYRFNKVCRHIKEDYSEPDTEYLNFENKFNPIILPNLKKRLEPYYCKYSFQNVNEEQDSPHGNKRCYSIENRVQNKLKMLSEEHISDTSTMYNR